MNCRILLALLFSFAIAATSFAQSPSGGTAAENLSPTTIVAIVGGLFVLVGALVFLFLYLERKRSQAIEAFAQSQGFTFRKKPTPADKSLLADTSLAKTGHSHRFKNVLEPTAPEETRIALVDFAYTTGSGKSAQTTSQTVMRMQAALLQLPAFNLRPETFLSKAMKLVGYDDINFPEHQEFSKKYLLGGQDRDAVRALFTPEIIQFCEQHPRICIEGAGDRLIFYRQGQRQKPENLESFLRDGKTVLGLFVQAGRVS